MLSCLMISLKMLLIMSFVSSSHTLRSSALISFGVASLSSLEAVNRSLRLLPSEFGNMVTFVFTTLVSVNFACFRSSLFDGFSVFSRLVALRDGIVFIVPFVVIWSSIGIQVAVEFREGVCHAFS